jgi:Fe-S-cluster-containing hydrogenase component 2
LPGRIVIDFSKCDPKKCRGGVCAAALTCPRKLLDQEAPHEVPLPGTSSCPECAKCVTACPLGAVRIE